MGRESRIEVSSCSSPRKGGRAKNEKNDHSRPSVLVKLGAAVVVLERKTEKRIREMYSRQKEVEIEREEGRKEGRLTPENGTKR